MRFTAEELKGVYLDEYRMQFEQDNPDPIGAAVLALASYVSGRKGTELTMTDKFYSGRVVEISSGEVGRFAREAQDHARRLERALKVAEEKAAKFVRRVEAGEVLSKQTYDDMKEVLSTIAKLKEAA